MNGEKKVPHALSSVGHPVDELVVNMHSEAATPEVALCFGAKVCIGEGQGFVELARGCAAAEAGR